MNDYQTAYQVLLKPDYVDMAQFCAINKLTNDICKDPNFWINKIEERYHIKPDIHIKNLFYNANKPLREIYLDVITNHYNDVERGSEKYLDWKTFIRRTIKTRNEELIRYPIQQGYWTRYPSHPARRRRR
jgi:hypothetical protein